MLVSVVVVGSWLLNVSIGGFSWSLVVGCWLSEGLLLVSAVAHSLVVARKQDTINHLSDHQSNTYEK